MTKPIQYYYDIVSNNDGYSLAGILAGKDLEIEKLKQRIHCESVFHDFTTNLKEGDTLKVSYSDFLLENTNFTRLILSNRFRTFSYEFEKVVKE